MSSQIPNTGISGPQKYTKKINDNKKFKKYHQQKPVFSPENNFLQNDPSQLELKIQELGSNPDYSDKTSVLFYFLGLPSVILSRQVLSQHVLHGNSIIKWTFILNYKLRRAR